MKYPELAHIGLTENEILVYTSLLKLGEALASKIAEETELNRSLVYRILNDLIKKGFVGFFIKENRKYFSATSPNRLITILKERETEIKKILPELLNLRKPIEKAPEVKIFCGKEGMKTMLEDVLETSKEVLVLGAKSDFADKLTFYHPNWHKRRTKLKIKLKALFEYGQKIGKELDKFLYTEIKFLPKETKSKFMVAIYKNKIAIELWFDYPTTILIEDKNIAEGFKNYFNLLWKLAHK